MSNPGITILFAGRIFFFQGLLINLLLPLFAEWSVLPVWALTINSYLFSRPTMSSPFVFTRLNVKVNFFPCEHNERTWECISWNPLILNPWQWMELSHLATWRATLIMGKGPVTHLIKRSVDTRTGLDILEKRDIPCICWSSNPGMSSS